MVTLERNKIYVGDAIKVLKTLPDGLIDCVITSPPYWRLRDYGVDGQIGLEGRVEDYIRRLTEVFEEVKRVLKKNGTCWVNIKDTYRGGGSGMAQVPARFAIAMSSKGWILWNEIIWRKPNQMPESAKRRFTNDYEKIYFFSKSKDYYFEQQLEPASPGSDMDYRRVLRRKNAGKYKLKTPYKNNFPKSFRSDSQRNKRSVWDVPTKPFIGNHEASYPEDLIVPMVLAGCPKGGIILDPFIGAGTTGMVAKKLGRDYVGIELNGNYVAMANKRIGSTPEPML